MENINLKDIDQQIIELTQKLGPLGTKLEFIESEIEDLESDKDYIEYEICKIERRIKLLKSKLLASNIDKFTGDAFVDAIILASMFCSLDYEQRSLFKHVYLSDSEIMATDSYRGIIINGLEIPKELQGKYIKWDVRSDFEANTTTLEQEYPKLKELICDIIQKPGHEFNVLTGTGFYSQFNMQERSKDDYREVITLDMAEKTAFNREYIEIALLSMGDKPFTVKYTGRLEPMVMYNNSVRIVVLPMRLND
ncbi:hypothetical protein P6N53_18150 [Desulforamulus aquiferis]|uniref:Uncharacterized protein n=2 Tax=Desulforamulus aquiferis TaxID=1397668 RepID=A0AAW7ZIM5_9FIRM|nr:hypothetical protein [Desulforamulus aquiferis]